MDQDQQQHACNSFRGTSLSRRSLIKVGGMGALGLTMPNLLKAAESSRVPAIKPRAKSVIFLFQWGGPSHLDMFDMKPDAPEGIRGPYKPIKSSEPSIYVSEKLPRTAKIMHKVSLIRTMTHRMNNHNSAGYYALTGSAPATDDQRLRDSIDLYPAYGSVVDKLAPNQHAMPTFVTYPYEVKDGSKTPGQHASFLGKGHDPLYVPRDPNEPNFELPELSLPSHLSIKRLERRREMQKLIDSQARMLDWSAEARGMDSYYSKALGMLNSKRLRQAFDLSKEPEVMRQAYGRSDYGQGCLLARRLVEHGVKFVSVYFSGSIGGRRTTDGGWDTHGFDNTRMFPIIEKRHLPMTEHTLPVLLNDLDQRGMLDETLVVWMGEFGRMPKINKNKSRDHWPHCYTTLLAGGGVKEGYVYGESDEHGAYPAVNPVKPDDLAATMYHLLGIDHEAEVRDTQNRPLPITRGVPVMDVIA